jgi:hypothetical protein
MDQRVERIKGNGVARIDGQLNQAVAQHGGNDSGVA